MKFGEGNVFTSVCQEFCPHIVAATETRMVASRRYASYWNAFLLILQRFWCKENYSLELGAHCNLAQQLYSLNYDKAIQQLATKTNMSTGINTCNNSDYNLTEVLPGITTYSNRDSNLTEVLSSQTQCAP